MVKPNQTDQAGKTILSVLLEQGLLDSTKTTNISQKDNETIAKYLLKNKLADQETIAKAYSVLYNFPFVHLVGKNISREALAWIPEELAQKFKIIPYNLIEKQGSLPILEIAVAEPGNLVKISRDFLENLKTEKGVDIRLAITTEADFEKALESYHNPAPAPATQSPAALPWISLQAVKIPKSIIEKIPEDIARKNKIVVFAVPQAGQIKVALINPQDPEVQKIIDFIRKNNQIEVEEYRTSPEDLEQALAQYKVQEKSPEPLKSTSPFELSQALPKPDSQTQPAPDKEETEETSVYEEKDLDKFLGQPVNTINKLADVYRQGNIPKMLAATIYLATLKKASDIHIEAGDKKLRVRYRIDGILRDIIYLPLSFQAPVASRVKILAKLKIDEHRIPQDGRFDVTLQKKEIDIRVSTFPTVRGEKAVMRLLDKSSGLISLENLGLQGKAFEQLSRNIIKPHGIIISCGPTGSGKTTTLYAIIKKVSTTKVNIITLEDPVEYEIPGINQCQVIPKIGFSFAEGLRSVLRQDPNIIMVGEIRDAETASMATHAALTGHLVLTTLHTNDAASALPRLINMGIEAFLITSSINCIVAQRLARKICPKCKVKDSVPEKTLIEIKNELANLHINKPLVFYKGKGCSECQEGYQGRVGIFEVLSMSDNIEDLAIKKRPATEIKAQAVKEGMITMKQDGILKALQAVTSITEILRVTSGD